MWPFSKIKSLEKELERSNNNLNSITRLYLKRNEREREALKEIQKNIPPVPLCPHSVQELMGVRRIKIENGFWYSSDCLEDKYCSGDKL